MNVLVGCECSGRVKTEFRKMGHNAYSCDIKQSEIENDQYHIQDDIKNVLKAMAGKVDLFIAHPDCTYLANSGARWLWEVDKVKIKNEERFEKLKEAALFFNFLLNQDINKICLENPRQHKWAKELIRQHDQVIQPWYFGEGEVKATCLWLKNLPPLIATYIHNGRVPRVHHEPPGIDQKANRSRTYIGIAKAMAEQWG